MSKLEDFSKEYSISSRYAEFEKAVGQKLKVIYVSKIMVQILPDNIKSYVKLKNAFLVQNKFRKKCEKFIDIVLNKNAGIVYSSYSKSITNFEIPRLKVVGVLCYRTWRELQRHRTLYTPHPLIIPGAVFMSEELSFEKKGSYSFSPNKELSIINNWYIFNVYNKIAKKGNAENINRNKTSDFLIDVSILQYKILSIYKDVLTLMEKLTMSEDNRYKTLCELQLMLPLATNVPVYAEGELKNWIYFCELRSSSTVHPILRDFTLSLIEKCSLLKEKVILSDKNYSTEEIYNKRATQTIEERKD